MSSLWPFSYKQMSAHATITGNCRFMSLVLSGAAGSATLTIRNNDLTYTSPVNLPGGNGSFNTVLNLNDTVGTGDGIFEIELKDSAGIVHYAGAFGTCALDCCISKKVSSILGCDCGCSKCNKHLLTAERVNLLILAIETNLGRISNDVIANSAMYTLSKSEYEKAVDLCSDSCGCSC